MVAECQNTAQPEELTSYQMMTVETMYREDKVWGKVCLPERESAGASCYSIRQKLWLLHAAVLILTVNEAALGQTLWLRAFSE